MIAAGILMAALALCVALWVWELWAELRDACREIDMLSEVIEGQQELLDAYKARDLKQGRGAVGDPTEWEVEP